MINRLTAHPRFPLVELGLVAFGGAILFLWPGAGWWPLLLALLPGLLRLLARQRPWPQTPWEGMLLLFLVTAVLATQLAYNPSLAWAKFRLIAAAILLYLTLAGQPYSYRWLLAGAAAAFGGLLAAYSLSGGIPLFPGKLAADLSIICLPFALAVGVRGWPARNWLMMAGAAGVGLITLLALLRNDSRGALVAPIAALGVWSLWVVAQWLARRLRQPAPLLYGGLLLLGGLGGLLLVITVIGGFGHLLTIFGGPVGTGGRYDIWVGLFHLLRDFRFSGSGLATFPGLYSQYILVIPFYFIGHGHNLLGDVALEQGVVAALLLLAIYGCSGWALFQMGQQAAGESAAESSLRWAAGASLLVVMLHGLVDDPLYGELGTPLLLFAPGMALALSSPAWRGAASDRRWTLAAAAAILLALAGLLWLSRPVQAAWAANRGAVQMAQIELADWPLDRWAMGEYAAALASLEAQFAAAIQADPANVTARYRLGLLAMGEREWETAVFHLQIAHEAAPTHRGVRKNLGYSTVWLGNYPQAALILADIPETQAEMSAYIHWWEQQGQPDLAERARRGVEIGE
jgi:hypothetical protein